MREGIKETSVPVIFSQDRPDEDDEYQLPHTSPAQEVWYFLSSCRSWTGQELPLDGLYSSTFLLELSGPPPDIIKPGTINTCQTTGKVRIVRLGGCYYVLLKI